MFFCINIQVTCGDFGYNVKIRFILSQHVRDEQILKILVFYLGCGNFRKEKPKWNTEMAYYSVTKFEDNYEKIRKIFFNYPILGEKAKDFNGWCRVAEIIKNNAHLTKKGLNQIIKIKEGMNKGRE